MQHMEKFLWRRKEKPDMTCDVLRKTQIKTYAAFYISQDMSRSFILSYEKSRSRLVQSSIY